MNENSQPTFFKNLKVIELASVLAGPAVGMFFAELGAEVIKIENKSTQGDITRKWKLPNEPQQSNSSAYYCSVNWGKTTLWLDLKTAEDQQRLYELIKTADVVVSNFKIASAQKLGVDFRTLKSLKPDLIFAQLTAFGEENNRLGFDVVLQAEAGFLYMTGEAGSPPVKMPVALIDLLAAHQLKEGILLALLKKERTGEGSYITVSLLESAVASLANQATNWLMANHIPQRMGSQHPNIAPYGDIFYTKDGKAIVLAIGTNQQFQQLCDILNLSHLAKDSTFATNEERVKNRSKLNNLLEIAFEQFEFEQLIHSFHQKGVPAGQVRTMPEVFEQPLAQQMILEDEIADYGKAKRVRMVAFQLY